MNAIVSNLTQNPRRFSSFYTCYTVLETDVALAIGYMCHLFTE